MVIRSMEPADCEAVTAIYAEGIATRIARLADAWRDTLLCELRLPG